MTDSQMTDYSALNLQLATATPYNVLGAALESGGTTCAISFSGAEDVLLIEYAHQWAKANNRSYRVFSLDTGRLHPQTYRFFQAVEDRYGIRIEYCFPAAAEVQGLVRAKGLYSFYADGQKSRKSKIERSMSGNSSHDRSRSKNEVSADVLALESISPFISM
jgi:adenylyl-sulfate reductase (glutathione)